MASDANKCVPSSLPLRRICLVAFCIISRYSILTLLEFTLTEFFSCSLFLPLLIESRSVVWPCTTSADCAKVPDASCSIYGFCQCPAGHVFSTDVTRCLPERSYGLSCEEAVQCSHMLTGAKCEDKLCTCDTGYTYVRGRCRQLANLGEPCNAVMNY